MYNTNFNFVAGLIFASLFTQCMHLSRHYSEFYGNNLPDRKRRKRKHKHKELKIRQRKSVATERLPHLLVDVAV